MSRPEDSAEDLPDWLRAPLEAFRAEGGGEPPARDAYREDLRGAFVSGRIEGRGSWVRALDGWQVPGPDPAFQARLRARFLAEGAALATPAPPAPAFPAVRSRPRREVRQQRSLRALRPLALAAAVLLAVAVWFNLPDAAPRADAWRVLEAAPSGVTFISAGGAVPYTDERALGELFEQGDCTVRTTGESLRVLRQGQFLITLSEDSEVRILPRDADGPDVLVVELSRGGLQVATGANDGRWVRVSTPDLQVEIRGRSIGVDVYPDGTCVCNLEGEASIRLPGTAAGETPADLEPGRTWFQRRSGESLTSDIHAEHRDPLEDLRQVARRYALDL